MKTHTQSQANKALHSWLCIVKTKRSNETNNPANQPQAGAGVNSLTLLSSENARESKSAAGRACCSWIKGETTRAVYNWQVPSDRHDVRSLDVARLAHFTHCGKPPSKINGRYDACGLLHREWRETWARVAAESGVDA